MLNNITKFSLQRHFENRTPCRQKLTSFDSTRTSAGRAKKALRKRLGLFNAGKVKKTTKVSSCSGTYYDPHSLQLRYNVSRLYKDVVLVCNISGQIIFLF